MQAVTSPAPARKNAFVALLLLWAVVAVIAGASGILNRLPFPPPLVGGVLTALLAVSLATVPSFRTFAREVDLRAVIALHLTRFVGFYFLYLYGQGRLPYAFAVPGGCGDNITAFGALILLALGLGRPGHNSRALLIAGQMWNVFGLLDILMVVGTGVRLALQDRAALAELAHLPLSLLPTLIVPLIIVSHFALAYRLRRAAQ